MRISDWSSDVCSSDLDLGAVAADIQKIVDASARDAPKATTVTLRGQVQTMNSAFSGLLFGLLGAIVLIYFLIVVNFQSWTDPFVIITALPAAIAGIVWMLFTRSEEHTSELQSLMPISYAVF